MMGLLSSALIVLFAAHPALGAVMSAGSSEIGLSDLDSAGGPGFSVGSQGLGFTLSTEGGVQLMSAGAQSLSLGFFGGSGSGGATGQGTASPVLTGGACPDPGLRVISGAIRGLPTGQTLCVGFDKLVLPQTLPTAVSVVKLRDNTGTSMNAVSASTLIYLLNPSQVQIAPVGGWSPNALYSVLLTTAALDQDGVPLGAAATFQFLTLADPGMDNVFVAFDDTGTRLELKPGTMPGPGYVDFYTAPVTVSQSQLAVANSKLTRLYGPAAKVQFMREINYYASNSATPLTFTPGAASLAVSVAGVDGNGIIQGTSPPAKFSATSLYYFDETTALWVKVPGASRAGAVVSAALPHLSLYGLVTTEDNSVDQAYAFPVPFRPNGGAKGNGVGQTGTDDVGITFTNIPTNSTVEVFNIRGESVWKGTETLGLGKLIWNVANSAGAKVASGVYLYLITSPSGSQKTGKLMVIR